MDSFWEGLNLDGGEVFKVNWYAARCAATAGLLCQNKV